MKVTRFHATADGESRFEEIEVPINERRPDQFGHTILQSSAWASPSIRFVELPVGLDQSWHHAPARQIVVVLSGALEVGTSDNQKRRCTPGQAFIADDLLCPMVLLLDSDWCRGVSGLCGIAAAVF